MSAHNSDTRPFHINQLHNGEYISLFLFYGKKVSYGL